jgi:hypothetical protein
VEEILVVTVERAAVGEDEAGLPLPSGAAAALRIVRWRGRHVAQMHQVQIGNVHAQFHRGRADQVGQTAAECARLVGVAVLPAEAALAPLAFARRDYLGGVFTRLQGCQRRRRVTVKTLEKGIDGWRCLGVDVAASVTRIDRVWRRWAAVAQAPEQTRRVKLVALVVGHQIEAHEQTLAEQQ